MTRVMVYIAILAALLAAVGGIYAKGYASGRDACLAKQSSEIIKEVKNEAQSFANRPRTRADRVSRLCQWAADTAENEGKPVKRPSVCAGE